MYVWLGYICMQVKELWLVHPPSEFLEGSGKIKGSLYVGRSFSQINFDCQGEQAPSSDFRNMKESQNLEDRVRIIGYSIMEY
jgi:hypothetical protein